MSEKKRILIVDDEEDIVDLVKLVLEKEGFELYSAFSGKECLDFLKENEVDLILLDIMMPEMDGWEVYRTIRKNKAWAGIKVAMLTAKSQNIDRLIGLHVVETDGYITKPFGRKELVEQINQIL